jgi:hypothetical protein
VSIDVQMLLEEIQIEQEKENLKRLHELEN